MAILCHQRLFFIRSYDNFSLFYEIVFSLTKLTELRAQCLKKHQKCLMILIISLLRVQMLLAVMKYETLQVIFKHCVEDGNRVYQENYRFHGNFAEILTGSFQSCWSPFFFLL